MKILLIMDNPVVPTGYGSTCRLTAREFMKKGHQVYAMAFNGGPNTGEKGENVFEYNDIKIISNYARQRDPNNLYGDVDTFVRIEKEISPDVYFWHNDSYRYSYMDKIPQNILDKSVFWLPYEGDFPDPLGPRVFGKCAAVRFVTDHALKMNYETVKDINHGVIPHAVDMTHLIPAPNKEDSKRDKHLNLNGKFVACRVDRHQPRKQWALTVKAFAKFAANKSDVFLLCKCNPRDCTMWDEEKKDGVDLEALARELGLSGKVFFDDFFFDVSYLPKAFYWASDVFITTTTGEGFGLTPVEAMACELPVIYPDTPVLPEVVGTEAGFQCKLSGKEYYNKLNVWHNIVDVDDVAAKLEECYNDWKNDGGKLLKSKGTAARAKALAKYDPSKVYEDWEKVLIDVSSSKKKVSIISILYNIAGESQLSGDDGIERLRVTMEQYVKHPYEWFIVDNGSPHREITRSWIENAAKNNPKIKPIFLDTNMGFGGANNIAINQSTGKYVLLLNPDSEAINPTKHGQTKDFVQILFERMEREKRLGVCGMRLMRRDDVMPGLVFPYFCCTIISKACLDAIKVDDKYFDEKFWPAYYEDADLVFRALSKGFKIGEQDVPFWHKSGGTNKHAIDGGKEGAFVKILLGELEKIQQNKTLDFDYERKRGEILSDGMQGLIRGNISYLNSKWGVSARNKIKVVWHTHIGAAVGFSQIAEGLSVKLHELGFDVYVNDWSNGSKIEDPIVKQLVEKTQKAKNEGYDFSDAINIVCWLMETFLDIDARYKVGISLCESTKVRESYLHICNKMNRILTFSDFCKGVQLDSGFTSQVNIIPPGVNEIFLRPTDRSKHPQDKFTFLTVGVCQGRKDIDRLVSAFCEAFPKNMDVPPECESNFPLKCNQIELVIKSNNFGDLDWISRNGFDKRANVKAIFTGWAAKQKGGQDDWSTEEMYKLYAEADCLVHPSHGEGIGMPICCPPETHIITPSGPKQIKEIKIGDDVVTHTGEIHKVERIMNRKFNGYLSCIRSYGNNSDIKLTPEHPVLVVKKRHEKSNDCRHLEYAPEWVPASEIKNGDLLVLPGPKFENNLSNIDLAEYLQNSFPTLEKDKNFIWSKFSNNPNGITANKISKFSGVSLSQVYRVMQNKMHIPESGDYVSRVSYAKVRKAMRMLSYEENSYNKSNRYIAVNYNLGLLMGYYASEGSICQGNNISFAFHKKEKAYHKDVEHLMKLIFNVRSNSKYCRTRKNAHEMIFSSTCAAKFFEKTIGKGSKNKFLSSDFLNSSEDFKTGFLRGLWRGDGSTNKTVSSAVSFSTSSKTLAYQIWMLLTEKRKQASIQKISRIKNKKKSIEYSVGYTFINQDDICEEKHCSIRARKYYKKSLRSENFTLYPVISVRLEEYDGYVHNIEVEKDHTYCVEGFAVHNCEAAATGCPVIFTNWSSPSEYFNDFNSYPCSLSPYPGTTFSPAYPGAPGDNGVWANIHIGHMKHLMYEVVRERAKSQAKGNAAAKHVKENYTWDESARRLLPLLFDWDAERKSKQDGQIDGYFDPLTFKKPNLEPVKKGDRVMIDVVTRDRHPYLACLLTSLLNQTFKDWDILIEIDDSDESVLESPLIMPLLYRCQHEGHGWRLIRSHQQGPHIAHHRTLEMVHEDKNYHYKLILRIDDDIYVRPDFIEKLYDEYLKDPNCEIGAVAGVYLNPKRSETEQTAPSNYLQDINYAGKIEPNVPWPYICKYPQGAKIRQVEHLYSSFLYRTEIGHAIGGYCKLFSQIGHREESDFSYRFHLAGYKLLLHPEAVGFHFQAPSGGIRSQAITDKQRNAEMDHKIYTQRLDTWHKRKKMAEELQNKSNVKQVELQLPNAVRESKPPRIIAVITSTKNEIPKINEAIEYFSKYSDEVYVTTLVQDKSQIKGPKLSMVANSHDEIINLTKGVLSEGDHDFVMMVSDTMRFQGDPLSVLLPNAKQYDDFVFEVYKTYISGRWNGQFFVSDDSMGTTIGPEIRNQCLITRKREDLKPDVSRTLYADITVVDDEKLSPVEGKSYMGNELVPLSEIKTRKWKKICIYQFPEGTLRPPKYIDVNPVQEDMVSIIIPTAGRAELLKRCLNTIYTFTRTPFEIIIVDNNSTDGTDKMLDEEMSLPRGANITLLKMPTNLGYQKAVNIGISRSKGKYILLYNDDAWVNGPQADGRCWLKTLIDDLNSEPNVGIVGPHGGISPSLKTDMLYFWCVMFRRSLYDEIGPLDDITFFNYGGDDDYMERIRAKGYKMKVRGLNLRHLMTCVPDEVKKPELDASRLKLIQKYRVKE